MADETISPKLRIALTAVRVLLTLAFLGAGLAKLAGVPMMVATFDHVGFGQWFRYVTGLIEVGGAILLWVPRFVGAAALLLAATMAGAILSHLTVVPGSPAPAAVLLVLSALVAWFYRTRTFALLGLGSDRRVSA